MKKILFCILIFQISTAQTIEERKKITQSYDNEQINNFIVKLSEAQKEQKRKIHNYKLQYRLLDSETSSLQRIYDGVPVFYTIENDASAASIRANSLQPNGVLGLNLTGSGITAGVWDGGKVRGTHQELSGSKVSFGDGAVSPSAHSTHVTGTIIGLGVVARARGLAYQAKAKTFFWDSDVEEMTSFGGEGYLVSNHSYGYSITNSFASARFGYYDQTSSDFDKISEVFPYYQIVVAAGNSRNSDHPQINAKGGFDMLTGATVSKNTIVVAAVNSVLNYTGPASVTMSSFSNYGPTDDGRIKPDISAKGVGVYSCNGPNDNTYETLSGTSMAAPAITGLIVLLQQHYNNLNATFMKAATARGLLCHTADEAGFSMGPDYSYGWGLANGEEAAKLISSNGKTSLILETSLTDKVVFTKQITISSPRALHVSIAWTDPVALGAVVTPITADNRTTNLVNNLDLKIINESGTVYFPWKLDPTSLNSAATQSSDNNVDNIEKVFIENAPAGKYTIQVTNKGALLSGTQDFTLIAGGLDNMFLSSSDFDKNDLIKFYPNPVQENLFFDLPSSFDLSDIAIYDLTGRLIRILKYRQINNIKVSDLTSGMYFVKFISPDRTINVKFIKK
ncbi:S8 family serine peptidase [Flavobacterium xueshanense]|uniref:Por secretion system C-terminal sorting domain-containing protein n=1 Tax=Flavobacterium xueshanense TaxID=935223 RepID=A0A1I1YKS1_9FLAO|nr:S8 family serine peptidase [Flavobacterium xueshanense]SFE20185.1 Por secretion system C-terminal sorting domain-containing protein [Flavobacterium xueshanense]